MRLTFRTFRQVFACGLAGAALLLVTLPVSAQAIRSTSSAGFTGTGSTSGGSSIGGNSFGGGSMGSSGGSLGGGISGGSIGGGSSSSSGGINLTSGFSNSFNGGTTSSLNGGSTISGSGSRSGGGSSFTSTVNPLSTYYQNPLAANMGVANGTSSGTGGSSKAFGQALYTVSTSSSGGNSLGGSSSLGGRGGNTLGGSSNNFGTAGVRTGSGGFGSTGGMNSSTGFGSGSTSGYTYGPIFSVGASMTPPTVPGGGAPVLGGPPSRFQLQLQDTLQQSSRLSPESKSGITVAMDGMVVVLRGTVASPAEAQLAANLLSLTPGVREIRSELTLR